MQELSNGLRAFAVHDPSIVRSGASLDIICGSKCDPLGLPGLFHLLGLPHGCRHTSTTVTGNRTHAAPGHN